MTLAERRANHNAIERARRESLNSKFFELASSIPSLKEARKPSKSVIVQKALEYIQNFNKYAHAQEKALKDLYDRNKELLLEVNELRQKLGYSPKDSDYGSSISDQRMASEQFPVIPSQNLVSNSPLSASSPKPSLMGSSPLLINTTSSQVYAPSDSALFGTSCPIQMQNMTLNDIGGLPLSYSGTTHPASFHLPRHSMKFGSVDPILTQNGSAADEDDNDDILDEMLIF